MSVAPIAAADAMRRLAEFDTIVDARSPTEYAEDHLPGAVNWPVLDDDERHEVGGQYVHQSPFDARKRGAALIARRIAEHLEAQVADKPRDWKPLVYCWRGGKRSGTLAWFLGEIGFRTRVVEGGYKAFRTAVTADLASLPSLFHYRVVCGRTGSGKTRLLSALADAGAQVLDLEGLARHRGSVLGALPGQAQPTQKAFDTRVWHTLSRFSPAQPVFVESESKKVGNLRVPEALIKRMREHGRCIVLQMPDAARVELLLAEYGHFRDDVEAFCGLLEALVELRGRDLVQRWQTLARNGSWPELFLELMQRHYDPVYAKSMEKNFAGLQQAQLIDARDGSPGTLAAIARELASPHVQSTVA